MSDFGGKLRQARERRGISLRQIAATTKISAAALEALERNDISKLPGGIFSRAFVRSYALEVGLDPEETVKEFLERFHGESVSTPAAPAVVPEHESSFESQQRMASVVLKLIVVSVPLVALILYFTLRGRSASDPAAAPGAAAEQPAVQPQTPAVDPPRSPAAAQPAPQPRAGELTLALHPTAECWVTLTVDGERIFSRVMQPGERELRQVRQEAVIQIGDAGAFAYSINGRPGRALGETGQVRTARITPENVAEYIR
jgi:cytoskeleton protein RodZ